MYCSMIKRSTETERKDLQRLLVGTGRELKMLPNNQKQLKTASNDAYLSKMYQERNIRL